MAVMLRTEAVEYAGLACNVSECMLVSFKVDGSGLSNIVKLRLCRVFVLLFSWISNILWLTSVDLAARYAQTCDVSRRCTG